MKKGNKKILLLIFAIAISIIFISPVSAERYNNYETETWRCCAGLIKSIPAAIPKTTSLVYKISRIIIPIVLVIFGMLDLMKGITSQKEDEIKKGQQTFVKRLIAAALVFFVFSIVKFLVSMVADNGGSRGVDHIIQCMDCFIDKKCGT